MPNSSEEVKSRIYKAEDFFGSLVPGRECGECTVCCVELKIDTPEIAKEPGIPCEHKTNTGCGIYETRFPVCRGWHCIWKYADDMPDEARPDRLGVMFGFAQQQEPDNVFEVCYIHAVAFGGSEALENDVTIEQLNNITRTNLPIWAATSTDAKYLIHPKEEIAQVILEPEKQHKFTHKIAAKYWTTGLKKNEISFKTRIGAIFKD